MINFETNKYYGFMDDNNTIHANKKGSGSRYSSLTFNYDDYKDFSFPYYDEHYIILKINEKLVDKHNLK